MCICVCMCAYVQVRAHMLTITHDACGPSYCHPAARDPTTSDLSNSSPRMHVVANPVRAWLSRLYTSTCAVRFAARLPFPPCGGRPLQLLAAPRQRCRLHCCIARTSTPALLCPTCTDAASPFPWSVASRCDGVRRLYTAPVMLGPAPGALQGEGRCGLGSGWRTLLEVRCLHVCVHVCVCVWRCAALVGVCACVCVCLCACWRLHSRADA